MDIDAVSGSGKGGRVLRSDVEAAAKKPDEKPARSPVKRAIEADDTTRIERVRMTPLRRTIARRLVEAQHNAAMLTTFNDVDMGAVMALRAQYKDIFEKKHGTKLGFMGFFTMAVCHAFGIVHQKAPKSEDVPASVDFASKRA